MKKRFLLLAMMLLTLMGGVKFNTLKAQTEPITRDETSITVGDTNTENVSANYPFCSTYAYTHTQQIYQPELIKGNLEEIPTGKIKISKIKYYLDPNNPGSLGYFAGVKVYMRNSLTSTFSSKTAWDTDFSANDLVFEGSVDVKDNAIEFNLGDKAFTYDPNMNLIIHVEVDQKNGTKAAKFKYTNTEYNSGLYYRNNNRDAGISNSSWISASGNQNQYVNVVTFTFSADDGGDDNDDNTNTPEAATDLSPDNGFNYGNNPQTLTWTFGKNTTHYQVLVGTEKNETTVINSIGQQEPVEKKGDNGSYTVSGLSANTTYYWQVVSIKGENKVYSKIAEFKTTNAGETAPVTQIFPENGATLKTNDVVFRWTNGNANHTYYTILLGESENSLDTLCHIEDKNSESTEFVQFNPSQLEDEKTYYWRVDVNNAFYNSESEVWSFTTKAVGNVSGAVKFMVAENEYGVDNATITIYDKEGNKIEETTTNNDGIFEFENIIAGNYNLVIVKNGYETYTVDVTVRGNETISLNIYMPSIIKEDGTWNTLNALPTENNELIVKANAVLTDESVVGTLTIESGKSVTIKEGAVLTVVGKINNNGEIIIEDGGQIYQTNENVTATFKMNIENPENWSNNQKGWQFIASPFVDATTASFVPSEGDYDLFKYEGKKDFEWVNYKKEISNDDGQQLVQIGEGEYYVDDFKKQAPLCDFYTYFASQTIYTAEEIGVEEGVISSISYNLQSAYENTRNISIYLKNTERTESYSSWEALTSDLCVFSGEVTYGTTAGWFTINLQNKFSYTGGNLLVTVIDNTGQYGAGNKFYSYETGSYTAPTDIRTIYKNSGSLIDPLNITTLGKSGLTAVIGESAKCLTPQIKLDFRTEVPFEETFVSGVGYLASYETEDMASLSGSLNNKNNFTFKMSYNEVESDYANFHLLGNPFTFNMDWRNVALDNVYNGFATINPATGSYDVSLGEEGIIPVGDGFFVEAIGVNPTLFYGTASKSRGEKATDYINIIATGKQGSNNVIVKFDGAEETGFSKLENINQRIADLYVKNNGRQYSILGYDQDVQEIEVFFAAKEMGSYSISLDINGDFENVVLVDRLTGVETNMLIEDEYSFIAASNDNPNRFFLRLDNEQQTTANSHFAYVNNSDIVIYNIEGNAQINIIDATGRCVYNGSCSDAMNRVPTGGFSAGIYVIQKVDENGVNVQKIVLE